ncbi:MAG: hypothetical protein ACJ8G3_18510 [Burkholderiaceae bacterium]
MDRNDVNWRLSRQSFSRAQELRAGRGAHTRRMRVLLASNILKQCFLGAACALKAALALNVGCVTMFKRRTDIPSSAFPNHNHANFLIDGKTAMNATHVPSLPFTFRPG